MPGKKKTPLAIEVDKRLYIMGMSRTELALQLEIGYQYLSNILCSRCIPTISLSERMAAVLGMSAQEIRLLALRRKVG